jgi:hypothetical protein
LIINLSIMLTAYQACQFWHENKTHHSLWIDVECFIFLALEILPTSPSSGQATRKSLLCQPRLLACHSGAAFDGLPSPAPIATRSWRSSNVEIQILKSFYRLAGHMQQSKLEKIYTHYVNGGGSVSCLWHSSDEMVVPSGLPDAISCRIRA